MTEWHFEASRGKIPFAIKNLLNGERFWRRGWYRLKRKSAPGNSKRHTKLPLFLPNTCGNVTRYLRPEGFHLA
jgi:hypothetical protein